MRISTVSQTALRTTQYAAAVAVVCVLLAPASASAAPEGVVTALSGRALSGQQDLDMHSAVGAGQTIRTDKEASCALLMDKGSVIQFCNGAAVRMRDGDTEGKSIVDLMSGELKATVGKRVPGESLEFHTPVAIATILGTVVHLLVDPITGDTTISSLDSTVRVKNSDPNVPGSFILRPGEQVTVRQGKAPTEPTNFDMAELSNASFCLDDGDFHAYAIQSDLVKRKVPEMERITAQDIPADVPGVGAGLVSVGPSIDDPDFNNFGPCYQVDCSPDVLPDLPEGPAPCGPTPGDHCIF
jgi:hypothetical protein